jgi:hypothetical protein
MKNQNKEINWRVKANRARKDIDNFTKYVGLVIKALDAQMELQASRQRGENIAKLCKDLEMFLVKLCNDLEMSKDLLRRKHDLKLTKTK